MIVSVNEHNEVMSYAMIGNIENGIEVSDDYQYLFDDFEAYKLMINDRKEVYLNPNFSTIEIPSDDNFEETGKTDLDTLSESVKLLSRQVAELTVKVEGLMNNA